VTDQVQCTLLESISQKKLYIKNMGKLNDRNTI